MAAVLVTAFSSCEKYLDIKTSNTQSPIETAEDCQKLLDDYGKMNAFYTNDGNLSSDEYVADEVLYISNGINEYERGVYTWASSAIKSDNSGQWGTDYNRIYHTNLVLEAVEKISDQGSADAVVLSRIRGAALFFRAYTFWQLAQVYCKPYVAASAEQDPGIPLRLSSDINDKSQRGSVQQTYSRIVQDLQEALALLEPGSAFAARPNKAACYAMLARVYQTMEDYPQALSNASSALNLNSQLIDFNTLDKDTETPFNPHYNKEVIFHSLTVGSDLLHPNLGGSYSARIISELVNAYSENDLRKNILLKENEDGTYRFTGNYEPSRSSEFFNGLAVDEMYLIRAESYARAGNAAAAMTDLNSLLATRWVTGTYVPMTAANMDEALGLVLAERRKELLMRGMRWTDLRRLNRDSRFAKTLTRTAGGQTYTLPPNDLRYTLLIPSNVITYGKIPQNSR